MAAFLATVEDGESVIPGRGRAGHRRRHHGRPPGWPPATFVQGLHSITARTARGADHKCGFAKVKVRGKSVDVDWSLGFGCKCY
jgi:hypothetical protein